MLDGPPPMFIDCLPLGLAILADAPFFMVNVIELDEEVVVLVEPPYSLALTFLACFLIQLTIVLLVEPDLPSSR